MQSCTQTENRACTPTSARRIFPVAKPVPVKGSAAMASDKPFSADSFHELVRFRRNIVTSASRVIV